MLGQKPQNVVKLGQHLDGNVKVLELGPDEQLERIGDSGQGIADPALQIGQVILELGRNDGTIRADLFAPKNINCPVSQVFLLIN